MSSLRNRVIRLAHRNAALRPHLLRALKAAEDDKAAEEDDKAGRFEEGPKGEKEFAAWLAKQPKEVQEDWKANTKKYEDKFKDKAASLFRAVIEKRAGCEALNNDAMIAQCEKRSEQSDDSEDSSDKEASLRRATIKLAHENPHLRRHLLPLLQG